MNRPCNISKKKGSSAANLQAQKSKQVESLKKIGAVEILRDQEYRVNVKQVIPPPLPPRRNQGTVGDLGLDQLTLGHSQITNILSEFPALKDMKLFELEELMSDEEKITEMVQKSQELIKFTQQLEELSSACVHLAKSNLSKKPDIDSLKQSIKEKNIELENLKVEFEKHCEHHMTLSDQYHPLHIQSNLKVAVMEADEESEIIAEQFLEKEIDVDEFLKKFMEKRTLCHLRRAKEEKLNHIILSPGLRF
ncbi:vacuolar protein sorting-associated protein 37A-like [Physella acuta]|uniref:vacuolar protein sorting-associated protein 37A-like n=1 Tax=Physella acuta TaxID=109671 RepID=UPI0027DCDB92|nr:vacuolar protein sorting-associated protein 37A-like [Physella acuta]